MSSQADLRPCPHCEAACSPEHQYCPSCGFPVAHLANEKKDRFVGRTLPGGYHILDLISVGGMGRVYRAEQSALRRTVAVKIIHPHLLTDDRASLRFLTEAQATSRLNHPNSVSVFDYGKTEDGQPYLVMEFLRGRDLSHIAFEEGPLSISRIINVTRQVLAALGEAHALGIVHRDLKPENIVLEPLRRGGDFVKVVDFGLAKLKIDALNSSVTSPGSACGTPDYMAPEQGRGEATDGRSDLYAVGVLMFQLLTGRLPFEAENPTQVVMMHISVPAPDPREVVPEREIPEALAAVVLKALAKKPTARYQDAHEFMEALDQVERAASFPPGLPLTSPPAARSGERTACPRCAQLVPWSRFCGECGAPLGVEGDGARSAWLAVARLPLPLFGRDKELDWLEDHRRMASAACTAVLLEGPPGVGKTRLVHEFLDLAREEGDRVVESSPDPLGAETAYYTLRQVVQGLLGLNDAEAEASDFIVRSGDRSLGLEDIFDPTPSGEDLRSPLERREALVDALEWAIREASGGDRRQRVIVAIDDLHRVDGVSRMAISDFLAHPSDLPVLFIATHPPGVLAEWERADLLAVPLLGKVTAARLLKTVSAPDLLKLQHDNVLGVTPLYLEQLLRYVAEGGGSAPSHLADIIARRLDTLAPAARRTLQALAVLGDALPMSSLEALLLSSDDVAAALGPLCLSGIVARHGDTLSLTHPLLRDVVLAGIPHAVRRDLHSKALNLCSREDAPLEVRAQHAYFAQDSFQALLLLEQVADLARPRGDTSAEILALRRALEISRGEIARGELDDPLRAILIFGRKLGAALTRAGAYADAEGVLKEALDVAGPVGASRAGVLAALAQVEQSRGRGLQAQTYAKRAVAAAEEVGDAELAHSVRETFQTMRP